MEIQKVKIIGASLSFHVKLICTHTLFVFFSIVAKICTKWKRMLNKNNEYKKERIVGWKV
jgi:hypothetical protein